MRSNNLIFISLLLYSTFSYISSKKTNLVSKGFMSIEQPIPDSSPKIQEQPKFNSSAKNQTNQTNLEACSKLADYLKDWDIFKIEIAELIKKFRDHIELYKSWQNNAFSKKDKEELIEKEKHILKTYINELLKVDELYKTAKLKHDQYKAQKCDEKTVDKDDDMPAEPVPIPVKPVFPKKPTSWQVINKDKITLFQITNLTKMLTLRMRELNMKVNNPAFMELSREVLPKDF